MCLCEDQTGNSPDDQQEENRELEIPEQSKI